MPTPPPSDPIAALARLAVKVRQHLPGNAIALSRVRVLDLGPGLQVKGRVSLSSVTYWERDGVFRVEAHARLRGRNLDPFDRRPEATVEWTPKGGLEVTIPHGAHVERAHLGTEGGIAIGKLYEARFGTGRKEIGGTEVKLPVGIDRLPL